MINKIKAHLHFGVSYESLKMMQNSLNNSQMAYQHLQKVFNPFAEEFWLIALNTQLEVTKLELIYRGTLDQCLIHPRDIFRFIILNNAYAFIMSHSHPSLNPTPSESDFYWTNKIHHLSTLFQIEMLDHIIFCKNSYFSFADHHYFKRSTKKYTTLKHLR